jgi:plastocyanin
MTVQACDTVIFTIVNRDVQAHGFAVEFYAANGLEVVGGDSGKVQFLAFKPGEFSVKCNTRCSIHSFMQNARLTVGCCSTGCC